MKLKALKKDDETGEIIETFTFYNEETGEEELIELHQSRYQRSSYFKIPSSSISTNQSKKKSEKEKIKSIYSPTVVTAIIYLLPTTVFFYPILAVFILVMEFFIHIWAHRKNRQMKSLNVHYQSPLHIICKEFCGACKEKESLLKITKLHEQRADKFKKYSLEYVRRIVT